TDLAALLALAAAYLLYLLVFCALTVGVSALAGSARTSLVVLLGFWVVSTLLLPRVAPAVAESLYPTPSAPAFRTGVTEEAENGADGHDPAD
ncbi:ABC transporter permease subunit, partial [Enterobacter hormaechei]|uniref:ABC transporter permease subunit n=2 Tax=Gammaproteobacteria TaxID=1236 RepID=UPI00203FABF6